MIKKYNKDDITLCPKCHCMTKTINGKCGKCKSPKDKFPVTNCPLKNPKEKKNEN